MHIENEGAAVSIYRQLQAKPLIDLRALPKHSPDDEVGNVALAPAACRLDARGASSFILSATNSLTTTPRDG
jgi:hypothetical protein